MNKLVRTIMAEDKKWAGKFRGFMMGKFAGTILVITISSFILFSFGFTIFIDFFFGTIGGAIKELNKNTNGLIEGFVIIFSIWILYPTIKAP